MWLVEGIKKAHIKRLIHGYRPHRSGICVYCGFSGTNDEMSEHAGEMCQENRDYFGKCETCLYPLDENNLATSVC